MMFNAAVFLEIYNYVKYRKKKNVFELGDISSIMQVIN